ncbi:hypothetical protein [Acidovorax carolinensis]|nr:hypothetical protein [Acidovorax carolinensis]
MKSRISVDNFVDISGFGLQVLEMTRSRWVAYKKGIVINPLKINHLALFY